MEKGNITVVGLGPGSYADLTHAATEAIRRADVIVGYTPYFRFVEELIKPDAVCVKTGMKREVERAEAAFEYAEAGKQVCVISSGDAGIYGMAPLVYEMRKTRGSDVEVQVLPGISAFQKAAALLGAPIGHDFCVISLSDLMTPWDRIEKRIAAAASADFVTAVYNPKSQGRYWQLHRLKELFLTERSEDTPVGYIRHAGRPEEEIHVVPLGEFDPEEIDMHTVVVIGNSQSVIYEKDKIITPRGYYREKPEEAVGIGQQIMIRSFQTIESELKNKAIPLGKKWALLHAIHTTADFDMEQILYTDVNAVEDLYRAVENGTLKTIITDVTMVASGIRKGALERRGIEVKCYLHDPRVAELASRKGITRTQAGIQLAAEEHPDALYVFGNAPTALIELCEAIRKKKATPCGVIAAPVGFVNVCESKHRIKSFAGVPKLIVEGRKGGSNLAATLVNAILTFDDADQLKPGRDV